METLVKTPPARPIATLESWLGKASSSHPIWPLLGSSEPEIQDTLSELDALLATIEGARPNRWMGKRRDFRGLRDNQAFLSQRAELLVAARLVRANITFEFGKPGSPQPDLVLTTRGLGIEVTSRAPEGVAELRLDLERALTAAGLTTTVILRFAEQPLTIPRLVRTAIIDETLVVARFGGGSFAREIFSARPGRPALAVEVEVGGGTPVGDEPQVSWTVEGTLLTPHLTDVEAAIEDVLSDERKVRQSLSMPSLLVIDLSRAGAAWLRPLEVWAVRLSQLLTSTGPYLGVAAMFPDFGNNVALALAVRPGAAAADAEPLRELALMLGLAPQGAS